jgi:threonine dehydrogenase-like Zn-dependent dehydrogenase
MRRPQAPTTDVARVLIVGCGCRGLALARALPEHAIRGTTRSPDRLAELETAGIERVVADPDLLATLVPCLSGVTVVCWLMGSAVESPDVHGRRLRTLMEHLVDTPVRGFVYEAGGTVDASLLEQGAHIVRTASQTWRIRADVVSTDPTLHEEWLGAMKEAVEGMLAGG